MTTILLVEDEGIVAKDIKKRLQKWGYTVSAIVSSGKQALEKVKEKPDLVLMDIILRGDMDGIETAGIIRAHYNIPVVYITAYAGKDVLKRAEMTRPYGYILKPFDDEELHTTIKTALYTYEKENMKNKAREKELESSILK